MAGAAREFEDTTEDGLTFELQIGRVRFDGVNGLDRQESLQLTATPDGVSASAALLPLQQGLYTQARCDTCPEAGFLTRHQDDRPSPWPAGVTVILDSCRHRDHFACLGR